LHNPAFVFAQEIVNMNRPWLLIALTGGLLFGGTESLLLGQTASPESEITSGNEVSFPIKYKAVSDYPMADGVVTVSKSTVAFTGRCTINRGFGRFEHCDFKVSPDKIIQLMNEPNGPASRLFLKVVVKDDKGDKEKKRDYYFYNAGAEDVGGGYVSCNSCDDSLNILYGVLTKFRAQNWPASSTARSEQSVVGAGKPAHFGFYNLNPEAGVVGVQQGAEQSAAATPVVPLKLPATFVNLQDRIVLNTDHSVSLQEAGQNYHGTFVVSGNNVELSISETGAKTSLSRKGDDLTDSSGLTWSLRDLPAGKTPTAAAATERTLHNADIVKLVKVGINDATIIKKIKSSKCQFDTSTDALVLLKKGGVRAAVLNAMVGAE
jgi:hypothetical protein